MKTFSGCIDTVVSPALKSGVKYNKSDSIHVGLCDEGPLRFNVRQLNGSNSKMAVDLTFFSSVIEDASPPTCSIEWNGTYLTPKTTDPRESLVPGCFVMDSREGYHMTCSKNESYIKTCLRLHKILMTQIPNVDFVLGAKVESEGSNVGEQGPFEEGVQRCVFARVTGCEYNKDATEFPKPLCVVKNLIVNNPQITMSHLEPHHNLLGCFTNVSVDLSEDLSYFKIVNHLPSVSPVFQWTDCYPVFHTFVRVFQVLNECEHLPEVKELLKIAHQLIPQNFDCAELQRDMLHPLVVVEGLDATGKTTRTESLEEKLNAVRYFTPPPCIMHLRKFFDGLPEIVRRAYYCVGNYIVAMQIAEECKTRAVIMDRYWHSTTAYGIANETSFADLPPVGHDVYQWPEDLLKPTSILFLTVSESVRKQRLGQRETQMTREERILDRDIFFRQRLCEAYRRIENPGCTEIDASGSVQDVMNAAVNILNKQGISLGSSH